MADVIGLSDVSSKDTGKGSQLKTGNLKRKYKMAEKKKYPKSSKKCGLGKVYDAKAKKCVSTKKKGESLIEWQMKEHKRSYGPKKPIPA